MGLVFTDNNKKDVGYLPNVAYLDLEVGMKEQSQNDFEITIPIGEWDRLFDEGSIFYDDSENEIGGLVLGKSSNTAENTVVLYGKTWRGLLNSQVVEPTQGQAYFQARGDANEFLRRVLDDYYDDLIVGSSETCGIEVNRDIRYVNKLEAIEKTLSDANLKLQIAFDVATKKAIVKATPIVTYDLIEVSNDYGVSFIAKDVKDGYNHCICLGKGELLEREVVHVYKLSDGTFTQDKSIALSDGISGLNDRCIVYDFSSAEDTQTLIDGGIKTINEKGDTKSLEINNITILVDIGDIVGGRERLTNIYMQKSIVARIYKGYANNLSIENKIGG